MSKKGLLGKPQGSVQSKEKGSSKRTKVRVKIPTREKGSLFNDRHTLASLAFPQIDEYSHIDGELFLKFNDRHTLASLAFPQIDEYSHIDGELFLKFNDKCFASLAFLH